MRTRMQNICNYLQHLQSMEMQILKKLMKTFWKFGEIFSQK